MNQPNTQDLDFKINVPDLDKAIDILTYQETKKLNEAKMAQEARNNLQFAKSFWGMHPQPSEQIYNAPLASGAGTINWLSKYVVNLGGDNFGTKELRLITQSAVSVGTSVPYMNSISIAQGNREIFETEKRKYELNQRTSESIEYLKGKLVDINLQGMVNVLEGAWKCFREEREQNYLGKSAGSLLNVISQTYQHFAPDDEIARLFQSRLDNYKPDPTSKRKGITRRHRFSYIADYLIRDDDRKTVFIENIDLYIDTIDALNSAHNPINTERLKSAVYSGIDLLETVFKFLE